jgi:hypothetical protein
MFYFLLLEGFCFVACFCPFFSRVVSTKKEQADKHTRKERTKVTKENREKHKWKHAECDHVKGRQKQKSSEAESFKHMKIKYPTHLKMAIWPETCSERQ